MDLIEIDDVIPKLYQDQIEAEMARLPWFFLPESGRKAGMVQASYGGFSHVAFHVDEPGAVNAPLTALLLPLLFIYCDRAKVPYSRLLRIRLGLFPKSPLEIPYHNPHVDFYRPHQNAVYYVNESDGDTVVFNETFEEVDQQKSILYTHERKFTIARQVAPKKGRIVGFDGKYYHASMHPRQSASRIAISFSFA